MITIDDKAGVVHVLKDDGSIERTHSLASAEGFDVVSRHWLRATWDAKYVYSFSWLGRPIIQLPDDLMRIQEVIFEIKPDVVVETGVAHGGSLIFHAGLLKAIGRGRVIGIDIEIRPHNRKAIEAHFLADMITLVEGSSTALETVQIVKDLIKPGEKVLVILDSNHKKDHVLRELELYGDLVSPGSYILATDGIMEIVAGGPRTEPDWSWNNPRQAAHEFVKTAPGFELAAMSPQGFNESLTNQWVTYFPDGLIRKKPA
jgi:cephalosporin hydroxylase